MELPLFRSVAAHPNRRAAIGEIVLARPPSLWLLTAVAAMILVAILSCLMWGSYTTRSVTSGQLVPELGIVKVRAPQTGIVVEVRVREGQAVRQGETLYVLQSERTSGALGDTQARISNEVRARIRSLEEQIASTRLLGTAERNSAVRRLDSLRQEHRALIGEVGNAELRTQLSQGKQRRYSELGNAGYVTKDQLLTARLEALDQQARLEELIRERINLERLVDEQQSLLDALPTRIASQISDYERQIASAREALSESEGRRQLLVVAPVAGVATAVVGGLGQFVNSEKVLLTILPDGTQLQAHLFAASEAIGFVNSGDSVQLRFSAYPYQKFGHYPGTVASVSRVSANAGELAQDEATAAVMNKGQPVYRIIVELASQSVTVYGRQVPLQAGMLVDADVMQETRRIYEWVLDPLTTLTGRID